MWVSRCLVGSVMAVALVVAAATPIQAAPSLITRALHFTEASSTFNPIQLKPSLGPGIDGKDNNALFLVDTNPAPGRLEVPVPSDDVGFVFRDLTLFANGAPDLPAPTFETYTSTFSGAPGTRLRLMFTQTQTGVTFGGVASAFEFNVLSGTASAEIFSYVDINFGFGLGTLLSSESFSGSGTSNIDTLLGTPADYTMTTIMEITFGPTAGIPNLVSARATLTAIDDPRAVPEPASLALLGAGLLGIGFARRRRR